MANKASVLDSGCVPRGCSPLFQSRAKAGDPSAGVTPIKGHALQTGPKVRSREPDTQACTLEASLSAWCGAVPACEPLHLPAARFPGVAGQSPLLQASLDVLGVSSGLLLSLVGGDRLEGAGPAWATVG